MKSEKHRGLTDLYWGAGGELQSQDVARDKVLSYLVPTIHSSNSGGIRRRPSPNYQRGGADICRVW